MKYLRTIITTVLLLAGVSVAVQAQERPILTATVPFAFTLENTDLPAGTYTVSILSPYNMIKVQSADGRKVAWIAVIPSLKSEGSKQAKLVFHRSGNEYFLAQVWTAGQNESRNPLSGKRAMELASSGFRPQTFTVVALADRK